ncbi:ScpA family protein [Temperatibacter marinus]|uniref:Segregation and condensation protein A n=1 Tax=Temperatibacter marinus TaxID=1456591 RepID=A0AA52EC27_9PROT|nr:ScpA family protein [Temperatibacter marinus]WND02627.1 ScpA family protein [Temperatibacter marinus]
MTETELHIPIETKTSDLDADKLVLQMEAFEGPLDVLLTLARAQKVDLLEISILELVEQYLAFVQAAKRIKLELAADYLVMAAWLAYLKSRLLLPKEEIGDEPSAEEMALRLQLRLQRLEAMRESGARLMGRDLQGRDTFVRGMPEGLKTTKRGQFDLTLYELLKHYGETRQRTSISEIKIEQRPVYPLEEALERLSELVGETFSWTQLAHFLPAGLSDKRVRRSALASMFAATLELAKLGKAEIQQAETFGPLYLRQKSAETTD